jgi:hypothetical protein
MHPPTQPEMHRTRNYQKVIAETHLYIMVQLVQFMMTQVRTIASRPDPRANRMSREHGIFSFRKQQDKVSSIFDPAIIRMAMGC